VVRATAGDGDRPAFAQIEAIVETFQPRRTVIDSLSTYGSSLGATERSFRDFFHAIVALMKGTRITAVYNHENPRCSACRR